ncbi:hypothetical protein AB0H76_25765 [Nocardia sp. NPDC050712]|uniref:hypothetical protein n=1 Tax=Nocardia sp. NPDC050712 TaxID=3155518 RepID=UPI0034108D0D
MNYDHLLLPSRAATIADVDDYLSAQQGQPESDVVAELAAELNKRNAELPEADTFLGTDTVGGAPSGTVLHVSCPYDAIGFVRNLLFELATPRDYALYDPQLAWLFDPADRVEVAVTHGGAGEFPYLTEALVAQWVPELADPNPFLIAERAPEHYIQTYRAANGEYTVEYRDGSAASHFGLETADPAEVSDLIWAWATGSPRAAHWSRVQF